MWRLGGGEFMADYRLYCLDSKDRIAAAAEWIEASTDEEAVALAQSKKLRFRSELWDGHRLVARIRPHSQG